MYLFAQMDLFRQGVNTALNIRDAWDETWEVGLGLGGGSISGSVLYEAISGIAVYMAVGSLALLMFKLSVDWISKNDYSKLPDLAIVLGIAVLLKNPSFIAEISFGLRSIIHNTSEQVLNLGLAGIELQTLYDQAQGMGSLQNTMSGFFRQCSGMEGDAQLACLRIAAIQSQDLITAWQDQYGTMSWLQERYAELTEFSNQLADYSDDVTNGGIWSSLGGTGSTGGMFWSMISPVWEPAISTVLWGWQQGIQQGLEATLFLCALMAPIAIGGSALPVEGKPIYAWLTGYLSVGMFTLSYNILVGAVAGIAVSAELSDSLAFPLFAAIFAPTIAMAMSTLGGMAVWAALVNGVSGGLQIFQTFAGLKI